MPSENNYAAMRGRAGNDEDAESPFLTSREIKDCQDQVESYAPLRKVQWTRVLFLGSGFFDCCFKRDVEDDDDLVKETDKKRE